MNASGVSGPTVTLLSVKEEASANGSQEQHVYGMIATSAEPDVANLAAETPDVSSIPAAAILAAACKLSGISEAEILEAARKLCGIPTASVLAPSPTAPVVKHHEQFCTSVLTATAVYSENENEGASPIESVSMASVLLDDGENQSEQAAYVEPAPYLSKGRSYVCPYSARCSLIRNSRLQQHLTESHNKEIMVTAELFHGDRKAAVNHMKEEIKRFTNSMVTSANKTDVHDSQKAQCPYCFGSYKQLNQHIKYQHPMEMAAAQEAKLLAKQEEIQNALQQMSQAGSPIESVSMASVLLDDGENQSEQAAYVEPAPYLSKGRSYVCPYSARCSLIRNSRLQQHLTESHNKEIMVTAELFHGDRKAAVNHMKEEIKRFTNSIVTSNSGSVSEKEQCPFCSGSYKLLSQHIQAQHPMMEISAIHEGTRHACQTQVEIHDSLRQISQTAAASAVTSNSRLKRRRTDSPAAASQNRRSAL